MDSKISQKSIELAIEILQDAVKKLKKDGGLEVVDLLRKRADWIETIMDLDGFAKKAREELEEIYNSQ